MTSSLRRSASDPELAETIAEFRAEEIEHRETAIAAGRRRRRLSVVIGRDPARLSCRDRASKHISESGGCDDEDQPFSGRDAVRAAACNARSARIRQVGNRLITVFGNDPCPRDEICVRAPENERYRIPKELPRLKPARRRRGAGAIAPRASNMPAHRAR
jgi:hypothetical protein